MKQSTLISNYLAKCLELSIFVWGYARGIPLYQIPILIAFFHIGYLIGPRLAILNLNKMVSGSLIIIGLVLLFIGFYAKNIIILIFGIIITASIIMQLKDNIKSNEPISINHKFFSKIMGMASGIFIAYQFNLVLFGLFFATPLLFLYIQFCISKQEIELKRNNPKIEFTNRLNWIQFFHHLHYFLFCYVFWTLINGIQPKYFALLFILGWIAYYVMERNYKREGKTFNVASIGYGHLFSGIVVLSMLFVSSAPIILFLWFSTGFGGGTIYMLKHIKEKGQLQVFEDWGHVLGCILSGVVIYISGSVAMALIVSFLSAVVVSIISWRDNRKIIT